MKLFFWNPSVMRSVLAASIVAITLPFINSYGAVVTYPLYAVVIWMAYWYVVVSFFFFFKKKKIKQMGSLNKSNI